MPQITLSVPQEKIPQLKDFLDAMGIKDKSVGNIAAKPAYRTTLSTSVKNTTNAFYKTVLGWDYFSNELEFE